MNRHLELLLGPVYEGTLAPEHFHDLHTKSGPTHTTIAEHKFRSCPPDLRPLLGFQPCVRSAYLIPFPDPRGGWLDYVKVKVFGDGGTRDVRGDVVDKPRGRWRYNGSRRKYLVRRQSAPHLYFPISTMRQALDDDAPVWLVEGMKKALAVSQLGLPAVGIESAWSWRARGSRALLPDFDAIRLAGRVVELVPDSDVRTNPMIARSMRQLADALRAVGARPRLVRIPASGAEKVGIDDFIVAVTNAA